MKVFDINHNGCLYSQFTVEDAQKAGIPQTVIDKAAFNHEKSLKLAEINIQAQKELSSFTATYPEGEVSTFDKQESEAKAFIADNTADTPLLDALATNREIDKAELATRIVTKATAFSAASGAIIGKRQKLEDRLNKLSEDVNSTEDIAEIAW